MHDRRCHLHVASSSLTPVICHVFMCCLGSKLHVSLQVFAVEGQNMNFTLKNVLNIWESSETINPLWP